MLLRHVHLGSWPVPSWLVPTLTGVVKCSEAMFLIIFMPFRDSSVSKRNVMNYCTIFSSFALGASILTILMPQDLNLISAVATTSSIAIFPIALVCDAFCGKAFRREGADTEDINEAETTDAVSMMQSMASA